MSQPNSQPDPDVAAIVATGAAGKTRRRRAWIGAGLVLLVGAVIFFGVRRNDDGDGLRYETEPVSRAALVVTVSATGTLEPTDQVDIGSELSGLIEAVLVDDNDRVVAGQVLARLDVSRLEDQIIRSEAALASAQAKVRQADATITEVRANLARLHTVAKLSGGKVPSKTELESAEATALRAQADAAAARAVVSEAEAGLSSDRTNLEKASIRSPIDGIVLARTVEPGQTVAASFSTPVLFKIAQDLARMELQVAVDEADVGEVREGQEATFSVDAYPNRHYPARIERVGYGSQTTDGVVSYKTILAVDNADLSLRPGMTATAEIITAQRDGALLIPNGALRFTPPSPDTTTAKQSRGIVASLIPRPPVQEPRKRTNTPSGPERQVWVLRDGEPVEVAITIGVSDGTLTEVVAGDLEPGMQLIVDAVTPKQ